MQGKHIEKIRRKKPIQKRADLTRRYRQSTRELKHSTELEKIDEKIDLYQALDFQRR